MRVLRFFIFAVVVTLILYLWMMESVIGWIGRAPQHMTAGAMGATPIVKAWARFMLNLVSALKLHLGLFLEMHAPLLSDRLRPILLPRRWRI